MKPPRRETASTAEEGGSGGRSQVECGCCWEGASSAATRGSRSVTYRAPESYDPPVPPAPGDHEAVPPDARRATVPQVVWRGPRIGGVLAGEGAEVPPVAGEPDVRPAAVLGGHGHGVQRGEFGDLPVAHDAEEGRRVPGRLHCADFRPRGQDNVPAPAPGAVGAQCPALERQVEPVGPSQRRSGAAIPRPAAAAPGPAPAAARAPLTPAVAPCEEEEEPAVNSSE